MNFEVLRGMDCFFGEGIVERRRMLKDWRQVNVILVFKMKKMRYFFYCRLVEILQILRKILGLFINRMARIVYI